MLVPERIGAALLRRCARLHLESSPSAQIDCAAFAAATFPMRRALPQVEAGLDRTEVTEHLFRDAIFLRVLRFAGIRRPMHSAIYATYGKQGHCQYPANPMSVVACASGSVQTLTS